MPKIYFRHHASEVRKDEGGSRRVTFVASDDTRDSVGTVLNPDGWSLERFNSNGIIGYQHKVYGSWSDTENPDNVIGKGRAYIEDRKLMVDVEFEPAEINPLAEKVYQKILFGSLKAVSVGFLPIGRGSWGKGEEALDGENPTYYYAGQELLEISVVNIPANPKALKKGLEEDEDELNALRKEAQEEAVKDEAPEGGTVDPDDAVEAEARELEIRARLTIAGAALL